MSITVFTPFGPLVIGPGADLQATSDLLPLSNPPWHWKFRFESPDSTFVFEQLTTTTQINEAAKVNVQWQDLDTPAALLGSVHARLNDSIKVTTTVTDDAGDQVDGPIILQVPWDPIAWLQRNQALWANNLVTRITAGGGGADKIDQILAAVYRTWPSA